MNESSITIRWERNPDGYTDISVCGEVDNQRYFKEAFLTLDRVPPLHGISETEISGESAGKSATITLLNLLTEVIGKSDKQSGHIITEQERNSKFPFIELVAIRKFARIAGIEIDERKFQNVSEFRRFFRTILNDKYK